ncbi:unnamed protein product [Darwinula stevensoni]|uniref:Uncharacterized protein n=1 Tax=Darwinula stevensoni TaxID=69355 RepID=A0A7R9A7K6_9CRUS|nr:unnamed protein product [Darwinula stevensoni]CAG0892294.1 unnamed protein product [Darwinula stevensoni]
MQRSLDKYSFSSALKRTKMTYCFLLPYRNPERSGYSGEHFSISDGEEPNGNHKLNTPLLAPHSSSKHAHE